MDIGDFQKRHETLTKRKNNLLNDKHGLIITADELAKESSRVADVAHKARYIMEDLDAEFESQVGLNKQDMAFLFMATALQCARIYLINYLTEIEKAGKGEKEKKLKKLQKKVLGKFDNGLVLEAKEFYAPLNQIIAIDGVPYDVTKYKTEKFGLFKGGNHRFATLGHDPVLGLIFGTANILTNTITCTKKILVTTNHVIYDSNFKNPQIGQYTFTTQTLIEASKRVDGDIASVVAALIKQIIHIGTDLYTPCGIQIPAANLMLSHKNTELLTKYISTGDALKIGVSSGVAVLINALISTLHMLTYNEEKQLSRDAYNVKTRKIIMYSNLIATSSNTIITAFKIAAGGAKVALNIRKEFDIAGWSVIFKRLTTDLEFINKVKEDFILGNFKNMIQGDFQYSD